LNKEEIQASRTEKSDDLSALSTADTASVFRLTEELDRTWVFEDLVHAILSRLKEFLHVERTVLFLKGKHSIRFRAFLSPLASQERFSVETLAENDPLPSLLTSSEALTIAQGDALDERVTGQIEGLLGCKPTSLLYFPLSGEEGIFGAFCALNKRDGSGFSERDRVLANAVASTVSLALRLSRHKNEFRKSVLQREMLAEVGHTVVSSLDLHTVLTSTLEALRRVLAYDGAAIVLRHTGMEEIYSLATRGLDTKFEDKIRLKADEGLVAWAMKAGSGIIVPDTKKDPRYVEVRTSTRSGMYAPLIVGNRAIGALGLESDNYGAYTEDHLELLTAFADQVAIMIERTRLHEEVVKTRWIEEELKIARSIQSSFLPSECPLLDEFEICGANLPYVEVGGDYYDFIRIVDHQIGIAIADVSGKGIPASLIMASFRASLLAEIRNNFAIRTILAKANALLYESTESDRFVTAFYGVLDTKNKVFTFSNAGHYPPIVIRKDDSTELLSEGGLILGVMPDSTYEERPVSLYSGDVLAMYTDGVTEAVNTSGEQFGQERLVEVLRHSREMSAGYISEKIVAEVASFRGEAEQNDDLTLIVIKVR
jgi:sigma-B regulation protein RsbU (phosphoserine phosphatase)